jgi:hypothetical protein
MLPEEIVLTIAEIAVALVGFSGVVAVLGRRGGGDWSPSELLQLRTLVEPSLCVLFGSLVPGTVKLVTQSEAVIWGVSNGAYGVFVSIAFAAFLVRSRSARTTSGQRILCVATVFMIGSLWLAAFGVLPWQSLIFVLGLQFGLVAGTYNFLLLLLPAPKS